MEEQEYTGLSQPSVKPRKLYFAGLALFIGAASALCVWAYAVLAFGK
jgi:hypothetical protein